MTARDHYTAKLKCPSCGRAGEAEISENDGWSFVKGNIGREIESVSDGFKSRRDAKGDLGIFCEACDAPAWPL